MSNAAVISVFGLERFLLRAPALGGPDWRVALLT
jgi:hypothetical protein